MPWSRTAWARWGPGCAEDHGAQWLRALGGMERGHCREEEEMPFPAVNTNPRDMAEGRQAAGGPAEVWWVAVTLLDVFHKRCQGALSLPGHRDRAVWKGWGSCSR